MHPALAMLQGGDRRSTGKSNEVVSMVLKEPKLFDALFSGMLMDDPVIRMRSADAAEKVTAVHPEYLAPYKKALLKPCQSGATGSALARGAHACSSASLEIGASSGNQCADGLYE